VPTNPNSNSSVLNDFINALSRFECSSGLVSLHTRAGATHIIMVQKALKIANPLIGYFLIYLKYFQVHSSAIDDFYFIWTYQNGILP